MVPTFDRQDAPTPLMKHLSDQLEKNPQNQMDPSTPHTSRNTHAGGIRFGFFTATGLLILLSIYCFAFQGYRGLWEPDEGRYSTVAVRMLQTGDWIHPHLHHEREHWTKPPLIYWAIGLSIMGFGHNEWAVRFPSMISYFLTVILLYWLGKIFLKDRTWLPSLIYISLAFPVIASNIITTDSLLCLWETAAIFCYACYIFNNSRRGNPLWIISFWVFMSLAMMTKGPVGLLPFISITVFRYLCPSVKKFPMKWLLGIPILITIGTGWYLHVAIENPRLLKYFVYDEIYLRMFSDHHQRNPEWYSFLWVFGPVLIFGMLPWTYHFIKALGLQIKKIMLGKKLNHKELFVLLWLVIPLLIFVFSKSKLPLYLLPLFVPTSLLIATDIEKRGIILSRNFYMLLCLSCMVFLSFRILGDWVRIERNAKYLARDIQNILTEPFSEVVFFGSKEVLGLSFYLNKEVEYIDANSLAEELSEQEDQIWLVPFENQERFDEVFASVNQSLPIKVIGQIDKRYVVYQQQKKNLARFDAG